MILISNKTHIIIISNRLDLSKNFNDLITFSSKSTFLYSFIAAYCPLQY